MTDIQLIDVSLRDGNQSLWGATGVDTSMVAGVSPFLAHAGYHTVELTNSTQMAVAVRYQKEDPWERIRVAKKLMPDTQLGFITTGKRFITFYRTPEALFELAFTLLRRAGITRLWVVDPMHDIDSVQRIATLAKRIGFDEVIAGICYTVSPVHTDEYYRTIAAKLKNVTDVDSVYLKDPGGVLIPERLTTIVPILQQELGDLPIDELHTHCTTGLAPLTLLKAADLGMTKLHTAIPPLADGSSHTNVLQLVHNLHALGHSTSVDVDVIQAASDYLTRQAVIRRLPQGAPVQYDAGYYRHTVPGGVQSTLRRQLAEMNKESLYDQIIEESVQVRADLGWPIAMTPFAQYIVTQATLNILGKERYDVLADEIVDLLAGDFGPLPGDVDENLMDRAMQTQRAKKVSNHDDDVTVADLRRQFGQSLSDEELLLRAVMPQDQVDAMVSVQRGPVAAARSMLENFAGQDGMRRLTVSFDDLNIDVQRKGA